MTTDPPRPKLEARHASERPHVLVVTDDPDLAAFLSDGLPYGGFWASVIANGLQVLEVFRLRQFDLLVIDAGLQAFDAIELLRRLRGTSRLDRSATARTQAPAVLIEGAPGDAGARETGELGIARVLSAPLELDEVVRSLHEVFGAWRADHPDSPLADSANARAF